MNYDIYEMEHPAPVQEVLDDLRRIVHDKGGAGITLVGNRLTIRWSLPYQKKLVQVHCVILDVEDGEPDPPEEDK